MTNVTRYLSSILSMSTFLVDLTGATPAKAGVCFDRCMTRCHLPMGYRYCRNSCFYRCDRRGYR